LFIKCQCGNKFSTGKNPFRGRSTLHFQSFAENGQDINESFEGLNEEIQSRNVENDGATFTRYSFVGNKYCNEYTESEEDEILEDEIVDDEEESRKIEEERRLYEAKIKILAPYMVENNLPDAFLQRVLKNSEDSSDLDDFKQSVEDEIRLLENDESDEKKEEERKRTYRQRCRDINECIELGIVDSADDDLYNFAADNSVADAAWNHRINLLKQQVDFNANDEEDMEEYKGTIPTMRLRTNIESYPNEDEEWTDKIVKENEDRLVKVKSLPRSENKTERDIEIFAVKALEDVGRVGLQEQVETLDFEKPDVAREQLNSIIESLQVLMKKLDQKRPDDSQSEYTEYGTQT
jgi:hypothetical protein